VVCQRSRREEVEERIGCLVRKRQSRFGETMLDFYTCAPVAQVP